MGTDVERADAAHVTCELCLKEVPASEAAVAEATDYVLYFCGLDCYETWRRQSDGNEAQLRNPAKSEPTTPTST